MTELIVTVNAPGEVAGWLLPLAEHVKSADPGVRIRAVLTPCPFAGGRERHRDPADRSIGCHPAKGRAFHPADSTSRRAG